jgi:hypothetical protein
MEWCLRFEDSGSGICDLILGPVDDHVCSAVRLEEATGRLQVMWDEHWELRALQNFASQVWDMVLKGSDEMSSLAVSLSAAADLIDGRVDAAATNGAHWGV